MIEKPFYINNNRKFFPCFKFIKKNYILDSWLCHGNIIKRCLWILILSNCLKNKTKKIDF